MKKCCENWLDNECTPRAPKEGKFIEIQKCRSCGTSFEVLFEEVAVLGDDGKSDYEVVSADPV